MLETTDGKAIYHSLVECNTVSVRKSIQYAGYTRRPKGRRRVRQANRKREQCERGDYRLKEKMKADIGKCRQIH